MKDIAHRPGLFAQALIGRAVLALVLALVFLQASQPVHLHKGVTQGLYNEEHVLQSLESVTGDVPLADRAPSISVPVVAGPRMPRVGARLSSGVARHADSRAPPLP